LAEVKAWSQVVENKRALLISADGRESAVWATQLVAEDWCVETVERRDQALARIPEFLPSLLLIDLRAGEAPEDVEESFAQRCRDSGLAAIVILRDPSPRDVAVSGRFRYVVSALSPPPILVTKTAAGFLPGRGKPLGLFKDASWEIQERDFPPNSALVVVSDGLMERIGGPTSTAREARLLELLTGVAPDHDRICDALSLKNALHIAPQRSTQRQPDITPQFHQVRVIEFTDQDFPGIKHCASP